MNNQASLLLQNGSTYAGVSFGSKKPVLGELVFNTGMVGYPETLTDPSYRGQILVLTYPLIGNYGVPPPARERGVLKFFESEKIQVSGLVISDYSHVFSHFQAVQSLGQWLKSQGIPALFGIDTRALTQELRSLGTMPAKIIFDQSQLHGDFGDGRAPDVVPEVTIRSPRVYARGKTKVMLIDCGVKLSILKSLLQRNLTVVRVPYDFDLSKVKYAFDGVVISNGPGDPKRCQATIRQLQRLLNHNIPLLGICLGNQLLGLSAGGDTYKLTFGHRSQNQPCVELATRRCYITSQNHGYALRPKLPKGWRVWFTNANDHTIEGIRHRTRPFAAVQFHPEANPGPTDTAFIFDDFIKLLR